MELKDQYGQDIQPNKKYTVATSNYLASGGDGFTAFTKGRQIKDGPSAVNTLANYIQTKYPSTVNFHNCEQIVDNSVDNTY